MLYSGLVSQRLISLIYGLFSVISFLLACASLPYFSSSLRNGVMCYAVRFNTRCLPIFTELHSMFYNSDGGKIQPPLSVLKDILTPVACAGAAKQDKLCLALAHIFIGYGSRQGSYLIICTDSFSVEEVGPFMTVYTYAMTLTLLFNIIRVGLVSIFVPLQCLHYVI
jgi:hypothetical protein